MLKVERAGWRSSTAVAVVIASSLLAACGSSSTSTPVAVASLSSAPTTIPVAPQPKVPASGEPVGDAAALAACAGEPQRLAHQYDERARLVGHYLGSVEQVASWQEAGFEERGAVGFRAPLRDRGATEVAVCFFDGEFGSFGGAPGEDRAPYDRGIWTIVGEEVEPFVLGYSGAHPIKDPKQVALRGDPAVELGLGVPLSND